MMDWTTGQPNARYWTLKMLIDAFGSATKLFVNSTVSVASNPHRRAVFAQGIVTVHDGARWALLVNTQNSSVLCLQGGAGPR